MLEERRKPSSAGPGPGPWRGQGPLPSGPLGMSACRDQLQAGGTSAAASTSSAARRLVFPGSPVLMAAGPQAQRLPHSMSSAVAAAAMPSALTAAPAPKKPAELPPGPLLQGLNKLRASMRFGAELAPAARRAPLTQINVQMLHDPDDEPPEEEGLTPRTAAAVQRWLARAEPCSPEQDHTPEDSPSASSENPFGPAPELGRQQQPASSGSVLQQSCVEESLLAVDASSNPFAPEPAAGSAPPLWLQSSGSQQFDQSYNPFAPSPVAELDEAAISDAVLQQRTGSEEVAGTDDPAAYNPFASDRAVAMAEAYSEAGAELLPVCTEALLLHAHVAPRNPQQLGDSEGEAEHQEQQAERDGQQEHEQGQQLPQLLQQSSEPLQRVKSEQLVAPRVVKVKGPVTKEMAKIMRQASSGLVLNEGDCVGCIEQPNMLSTLPQRVPLSAISWPAGGGWTHSSTGRNCAEAERAHQQTDSDVVDEHSNDANPFSPTAVLRRNINSSAAQPASKLGSVAGIEPHHQPGWQPPVTQSAGGALGEQAWALKVTPEAPRWISLPGEALPLPDRRHTAPSAPHEHGAAPAAATIEEASTEFEDDSNPFATNNHQVLRKKPSSGSAVIWTSQDQLSSAMPGHSSDQQDFASSSGSDRPGSWMEDVEHISPDQHRAVRVPSQQLSAVAALPSPSPATTRPPLELAQELFPMPMALRQEHAAQPTLVPVVMSGLGTTARPSSLRDSFDEVPVAASLQSPFHSMAGIMAGRAALATNVGGKVPALYSAPARDAVLKEQAARQFQSAGMPLRESMALLREQPVVSKAPEKHQVFKREQAVAVALPDKSEVLARANAVLKAPDKGAVISREQVALVAPPDKKLVFVREEVVQKAPDKRDVFVKEQAVLRAPDKSQVLTKEQAALRAPDRREVLIKDQAALRAPDKNQVQLKKEAALKAPDPDQLRKEVRLRSSTSVHAGLTMMGMSPVAVRRNSGSPGRALPEGPAAQ